MSHFAVFVLGLDVAAQLAPYHEFECTGLNDQYVKDVDITSEVLAHMAKHPAEGLLSALEYRGLDENIVDDENKVDINGAHQYGYAVVRDDTLVKAVRRTNPNARWDWYAIGGRWTGFLKLKDGAEGTAGTPGLMTDACEPGHADIALKSAIDFEGMRNASGTKAAELWDKAQALTGGETWEPWETVLTRFGKEKVDAARDFYHDQPAIKKLKADRDNFGWNLNDALSGPRDAFVQAARDRACTPYAIVHKGEWTEKGKMGWWGMSIDDMSQAQWNRLVNELLDGLPDDTLITVVDCHI